MKKDWMIKESELDDDQLRVLMATLDKSCIVMGCAGSGKSVLALIKAQRIQKERGDNYEIIVFTKTLCNYMNSGRKELGLRNQFVYHWRWKNDLNYQQADYIIVDEIQDFTKEDIKEFLTATKKHFFFFGDTSQSIYEGLKDTIHVEDIGYLFPERDRPKMFELYRNYRLPLPVARLAQYVGIGLPEFEPNIYKSTETNMPHMLEYNDKKAQILAIKQIIEQNDLADVAILVPKNNQVRDVYDMLGAIGMNCEIRYSDKEINRSWDTLNFSTTNPKVMTYHSAKGLQFETVFLPFTEDIVCFGSKRKSLYVAITRTYKNLYIMYSGYLQEPLSRIPSNLYKTTEEETFEMI